MVDQPTDDSDERLDDQTDEPTESEWERKRRLAEIFGDVLPATTSDERGPGESTQQRESAQDAWLRSQVPPHHGGN